MKFFIKQQDIEHVWCQYFKNNDKLLRKQIHSSLSW